MEPELTRNEVADILEASYSAYTTFHLREPAFFIESLYVDFFIGFVKWVKIAEDRNFILFVQQHLEKPLHDATMQICRIISEPSADGSAIWNFVNASRIILRRDQQQYNRQLSGKSPKGIICELWHEYNHWLIAVNLWKGFVTSLQPSFSVVVPTDSDEPIEKLLAPAIKPLWGMWEAYNDLGRPLLAMENIGDSINVKPYVSFVKYKKQFTGKQS